MLYQFRLVKYAFKAIFVHLTEKPSLLEEIMTELSFI